MNNKKILILYAPLGAGHKMAAKAIEEAFVLDYPEFEIKVINVLDFSFRAFRAGLPRAFDFASFKMPFLYKWIYDCFNHQSRYNFLNRVSGIFIKKSYLVKFIKEFNPDFILSTNPLPMQLVSLTKHQKIIDILSANVCTDFGFHSLWSNQDVNYYFVSNDYIKKSLVEHKISREKIIITGIPISSKFSKDIDRQKILNSFNFDVNAPTLLIIGGKMRHGAILKIIEKVEEKIVSQFIIIAGRDKKLEKKMKKLEFGQKSNVKIFGFVNNVQDYMASSDLILTKAGGLTVSECINMNLPMIINDFSPGQEEDNVKYIVDKGAGFQVKNTKEAVLCIVDLLSRPEKLKEIKENCRKIARPNAAKDLADFVAKTLENQN